MSQAPVMPESWTVMKLLNTSAKYLAEKGSPSGRLDAELLLCHTLSTTRLKLYTEFDKPILDTERAAYRELIRRRAAGEPVAYILGRREFYGRTFAVDARVLVPRPETELLIDLARSLYDTAKPWVVADFGTGSGAIAVSLALEFPQAQVVAVDMSADALAVARANAVSLGAERVEFLQGDWTAPVEGRMFDWIVSNPPYVGNDDPEVEPGVRKFEPGMAVFSGPKGMDALIVLAQKLPAVLKAGGTWFCEFGSTQVPEVKALLNETGWTVKFENDLAGLPRIFSAVRAP